MGSGLKYRPDFSVVDGVVNIPVIFAKVSGVKDGHTAGYWTSVKELVTEDTVVIKRAPLYRADGTESDENVCC